MAFPSPRRLAATALLAALALPVLAQTAPATPPAASASSAAESRHQAGHRHGRHHGDHAQRHARHLAELKGQLQLPAAQEPAWAAFTAALQPAERPARLDREGMDKLTTPERIDRMRALRAQHAAEADRRGEATKAFYAALAPEQQKTFDARTLHGHRMGGMKGAEGRHGHGGHGGHGKPAPAPAQ